MDNQTKAKDERRRGGGRDFYRPALAPSDVNHPHADLMVSDSTSTPSRVRGWANAAAYVYAPRSTFIEWVRRGDAPPPDFRCGRVVWWRTATLDAFLERHSSTVTPAGHRL